MAMMMSVGASQTVSAAQVCFPRTPTKQLMSLLFYDHVMFCGQPKSLHLGNGTVCFCSDKNTSFPELYPPIQARETEAHTERPLETRETEI
jgi:hypothetical protein